MFFAKEINFSLPADVISSIHHLVDDYSNLEIKDQSYQRVKHLINTGYVDNPDVTFEEFNIIKEQVQVLAKKNYGAAIAEYLVPEKLKTLVLKNLPTALTEHKPRITLQIIKSQRNLTPHRDHDRISSIMYVINSNSAKTRWYEAVGEVKMIKTVRSFDPGTLKEIKEMQLEDNHWYIFDHHTIHSVNDYADSTQLRSAFCIEFADLSADMLYSIVNR